MSLVLWSGGCDSTLVLAQLLDDEKKNAPVRVLSVAHNQVSGQAQMSRARVRLLEKFRKQGHTIEVAHLIWEGQGYFFGCDGGGLIQPPIWLLSAVTYLLKDEDLYTGWIRGDDIWHHKAEILPAFQNLQQMMGKTGGLVTPLEWESKAEVLQSLRKRKLLHLTWSCENPNKSGRACRTCTPCRTQKAAGGKR